MKIKTCYYVDDIDHIIGSLFLQPKCEVIPGYCIRISTGAPLPAGADAVVQVEDTDLIKDADGGCVELEVNIHKAPTLGQDIRYACSWF